MALLMWAEVWRQVHVELSDKRPHLLFLYQGGVNTEYIFCSKLKKIVLEVK